MARIRSVKPEFWNDEKLSLLDARTRLVFLGLIGMADDYGRLVDNVKAIDACIFPNTEESSGEALAILTRLSRIVRYTAPSGQRLIQIAKWAEHQRVQHPHKEILPPPTAEDLTGPKDTPPSTGAHDAFAKDSGELTELRVRKSGKSQASIDDRRPTTDEEGAGVGAAAPDPGGWTARAQALFAEHIGEFTHGRVGKALKPLIAKYGEANVFRWLDAFCRFAPIRRRDGTYPTVHAGEVAERRTEFCTPESFANNLAYWRDFCDTPLDGAVA